jgi:hypothetical protein
MTVDIFCQFFPEGFVTLIEQNGVDDRASFPLLQFLAVDLNDVSEQLMVHWCIGIGAAGQTHPVRLIPNVRNRSGISADGKNDPSLPSAENPEQLLSSVLRTALLPAASLLR